MVSRWLPLYLIGIAALTLFPFAPPACPHPGWTFRMGTFDFFANLAAFFPIGLALRRSALWRTVALSFALSLSIELCQQWLPRQQDLTDLIANTGGAVLGWSLARLWRERWSGPLFRPITRNLLLRTAAVCGVAAVSIAAATSPRHDFSNWQPFPIVIGNSAAGDRPWMGSVSEIALYDRALGANEEVTRLEPDASPALWAEGGPVLWLRFTEGNPVARSDGPGGPIRFAPQIDDASFVAESGVNLLPSGVRLDPWVSEHVLERLQPGDEMTLDVRFRSHVIRQHGPARIVSMGDGRRQRNFMIGQRRGGLASYLRTPAAGPGGVRGDLRTKGSRVTGESQWARFVYDGAAAALYLDGSCEDSEIFAIGTASLLVGPLLGISIVACTALAGLALASLARPAAARVVLVVGGGALGWLWLEALGVWSHLPGFDGWAAALGVATLVAGIPVVARRRSEA